MIKYPMGRPKGYKKDLGDWVQGTIAATGGLGPLQAVQNASEMSQYGRNPAVVFAGPTVSLALDIATGDSKPSRFIPLVTQMPMLSKPLDKAIRDF